MDDKWQEVLIDSPYGKLTKQDIYDYYTNPKIKRRLLELRGQEIITRQNFDPETIVLRRKDPKGQFLKLTPKTYEQLVEKRLTEIHPVFGKETDTVVVDIDPGKSVPWNKTKATVQRVAERLQQALPIKDVTVQFSGNRGFYVKGRLPKKEDIDVVRSRLRRALEQLLSNEVVAHPPQPDQIRLDLSPMKFRGSYKAPYSLDARTGLVAAPLPLHKLPTVKKQDFHISKYSADMFAPGIPAGRVIHPIPEIRDKQWQLAIQEHLARRAGKHWDIRFVDPVTQMAHSFAVPRSAFPKGKRVFLAIQQPTHTADYATTFSGTIPEGYGAGEVKLREVSPINIEFASPNRIIFNRNGKRYALFRMQDKNWGIRQL